MMDGSLKTVSAPGSSIALLASLVGQEVSCCHACPTGFPVRIDYSPRKPGAQTGSSFC